MKAALEFDAKDLERSIDLVRHIASFARITFSTNHLSIRVVDPAKVTCMDIYLYPSIMKCDFEFEFGINVGMFYKLIKSMDPTQPVEIEADESVMKLSSCGENTACHTLVSQQVPTATLQIPRVQGPSMTVSAKAFQKYVRALAHISPAVELNFIPIAGVLFMESLNSMYRTIFSLNTAATETGEEYRKSFMAKFLEISINPSLSDDIELIFGDALGLHYKTETVEVDVQISAYTEG
jgi:hypothetical protein